MSDALAAAIALEEHRQGRPYDGGPDHCGHCWDAWIERRQAACAHEETVDIRTLCDATLRRLCNDCGAEITEEDE